jgi:hypothetical protein
MRLGLNILSNFLHSLKPRKLLSSSRNTYLPNIFARHNPRLAARAARIRASKSASRIRTRPVSAAPSFASADGTHHRRRNRHSRSLKRSTTNAAAIHPAQVPSYPQPPGAYAYAPPATGDVPNTNHDADPAALVAQKIFFEELYKQRAVLLRAADERREAAEAEARQHSAEENAEYLWLLAEDQRKAQEAQRRAEEEEEAVRREEERRQAQERRRRREERRRRHAAHEERRERARLEQERLERERLEEERRKQERLEQERRAREDEALCQKVAAEAAAVTERVAEWHRFYAEKWAVLRADAKVSPLAFSDIPWPLFGIPKSAENITLMRVREFLCHPQRESVQSAGQAKSLRSEMLRWHPDKFDAKVLNKVMDGDREAVKEAAGKVARILTQLTTEMQGR